MTPPESLAFPGDPPKGLIESMTAYDLIAKHGVGSVESHPACERVTLGNGEVVTLWFGGDEVPTYWTFP